ncbi:MAG: radical SAM protein [Thermofilum sp.]|uniref:Radical SAM protein n=1 Tax=Thermofilum pendens TaxID=2269 RepID=A0A7C4D2C9_THEPE
MRRFLRIEKEIPLLGHVAFGVIDRGTNLLQVRPTSFCPLSCIFCSVDSGPNSRLRQVEFEVDKDYLVQYTLHVIREKGLERAHIHIDAVGDPLTYPRIVELVRDFKASGAAESIALETHGALLTEKLAQALDDAGLDRVNVSVDALNPEVARVLAGTPWFNVERVKHVVEYIAQNLRMDVLIAPVWVPGVNDSEIARIIEWALSIGAGKRWPPLGIQKYEAHKYGRKVPGVKPLSWHKFYTALKKWESEFGVKLILKPQDFGIKPARRVPVAFEVGEKTTAKVAYWGWLKGQWLAVARGRVVTIAGVQGPPPINAKVAIRLVRVKDNIYVARLV